MSDNNSEHTVKEGSSPKESKTESVEESSTKMSWAEVASSEPATAEEQAAPVDEQAADVDETKKADEQSLVSIDLDSEPSDEKRPNTPIIPVAKPVDEVREVEQTQEESLQEPMLSENNSFRNSSLRTKRRERKTCWERFFG